MRLIRYLSTFVVLAVLSEPAFSQLPAFTTQTPLSGNSGGNFFVFLPISNIGNTAATNMQLTSVTLNHLGSSAADVRQPAKLPSMVGVGYLAPTGVIKLDLEFDNSSLTAGTVYLVTVRGTYQVGNKIYGFALNRPVPFTQGFVASHQQLLDTIGAKFDSVAGLDQNAINQSMLQFVSGLPQVSSAGIGETSSLIWVDLTDTGSQLVIYNNKPTQPVSALRIPASASPRSSTLLNESMSQTIPSSTRRVIPAATTPSGLPTKNKAHILYGFGAGFGNSTNEIRRYLFSADAGYTDAGSDATVAGFRAIADDGILYISSHGGADIAKGIPFHIWTSQPTDPKCYRGSKDCPDGLLQQDLDQFLVDQAEAYNTYDPLTKMVTQEWHYHINARAFAHAYWTFAKNSFVFLDVCESEKNDASVRSFKEELAQLGVSVYAGWTAETSFDRSVSTALFVFDRLLGANQFCPENGQPCAVGSAVPPIFAQRPFDYVQTTLDLGFHSLLVDPFQKASLVFDSLGGSFGLLAPSIGNMLVDEAQGKNGQLTIHGIFGADPRLEGSDGTVEIGGSPANIFSWDTNQIVVDLTSSSAGDVVVTARGHKSNVARITSWQSGGFDYTTTEGSHLKVDTIFNIHFRADIRKYRPVIHQDPIEPSGLIFAIPDSVADFTCSGSDTIQGETYSLSGQGSYPAFTLQKGKVDNTFQFTGNFLDSHEKITFGLGTIGVAGCTCKVCDIGGCTSNAQFIFGPSNPPVAGAPFLFTFNLDDKSAEIGPGRPPNSAPSVLCEPEGNGTGVFNWSNFGPTNDTAPDPNSAR